MRGTGVLLLASLALASVAAADEFRLKDGTKVVGTIVSFEDGTFKVQTSYGFALVRKDKIAAIIPAEPKPEPNKEATTAPLKKSSATPALPAATLAAGQPKPSTAAAPPAAIADASVRAATPPAAPSLAASAAQKAPAAAERPVSADPKAAASPPPAIREEVQGNYYVNHTYGFRIYKPPSWQVIEGAQSVLPAAVVAMGTSDETTLLVVGHEPLKGSLDSHSTVEENQVREIYENYRRLSTLRTQIGGCAAIELRFRGTADEHDWSGTLVSLVRGNEVFTILGMTSADSDLIQIQENVIAKTVASLEFFQP